MNQLPRIAIYSGEVPSTTFIENLIKAVGKDQEVLLFGLRKERVAYESDQIKDHSHPGSGIALMLYALRMKARLMKKDKLAFAKLKDIISSRSKSRKSALRLWAKYAPVLWDRPDIFHIQWGKSLAEWMFLQESFQIPIVLSLRGAHINYSPLSHPALAEAYRRHFPEVKGFHAVSNAISKVAQSYGAAPEKCKVIYTGMALKNMDGLSKIEYKTSSPLRILSVGRFHWKKGYHLALDVLSALKEKKIAYRYDIIAGDPPEEILYKIAALGLEEHVVIHERMPHHEVFNMMIESDVFLLPSVEEGVANVVVEAMRIGLPVISSDCGGMLEAIEDGVTGIIFKSRDREQMLESLNYFMHMTVDQRKEMADKAKESAKAQFSLERLGTEMKEFYQLVS